MRTERTEKNIALAPELLAEVAKVKTSEHRTTDELMNEVAQSRLKTLGTIVEMRAFIARNREGAIKDARTDRSIAQEKHRY